MPRLWAGRPRSLSSWPDPAHAVPMGQARAQPLSSVLLDVLSVGAELVSLPVALAGFAAVLPIAAVLGVKLQIPYFVAEFGSFATWAWQVQVNRWLPSLGPLLAPVMAFAVGLLIWAAWVVVAWGLYRALTW